MKKQIKWGIMGCGWIAEKFAKGLKLDPSAIIYAVGSREQAKANEFARIYGATKAYGSYNELALDSEVDIIYIATPHVYHCENTLLCLNNNKAVLCEKPFAMNEKEVKLMIDKAREKKLFLMEGLWTRFFPIIEKTLELIHSGTIGEVTNMRCDFGYKAKKDPDGRLYNPALGGGSLLDIGIYPVLLSKLIMGEPKEIQAMASLTDKNIDESISITFKYENNSLAQLFSTFAADTDIEASIYGTKGRIRIHRRWFMPTSMTITYSDEKSETITLECPGDGYHYEAIEVTKCMQEGLLEHPKASLDFSLKLIRTLDNLRQICRIKYAND